MTLLDFVRLTRAHVKLLLIAMAAGLVIAGAWTALQPIEYTATSTGVVTAGGAGTIGEAQASTGLATSRAGTYAALARAQSVRERVGQELGAEGLGSFSASVGSIPSILNFTASASTREAARDQANALAVATAAEAVDFEKIGSTADPVVRIVPMRDAALPGGPSSPNWPRNLLIGLGAGLVAGYALLYLRRTTDSKIRTTKDVEALTGANAMAVIPLDDGLSSKANGPSRHSPAAEALRQLRTNLRFVDVDKPPRSIVITSPQPNEGKSTIATNIGRLLAESGIPTVVVDADLRNPHQARRFGIDGSVGLTQVLAGDVALETALQQTDVPGLLVLPSGRIPPNPSELLGSHRMSEVVQELSTSHMVILDTTPVLPVADAGLLTATCDGALLVMAVGRTNKEQVRHSAKVIAQVNGRLLGAVLNKASRKDIGSIYYGAGYGGYGFDYYGYMDDGKGKRKGSKRKKAETTSETPRVPTQPLTPPARADAQQMPEETAPDQVGEVGAATSAYGSEPTTTNPTARRAQGT